MQEIGMTLRIALPEDADAVTAVLADAYAALMPQSYDTAALAAVLPAMTRANPTLLTSGTYYVQELADGRIVACGGWTHEEPGTGKIELGIAHVRHFATASNMIRRGLASRILGRCITEAGTAGVHTLMTYASLHAEPFYASFGFVVLRRTAVEIGQASSFATSIMALHVEPRSLLITT